MAGFCHTADETITPTTSPVCEVWKTRTCTPNSPPTSCRSPARPGPTCSTPTDGAVRFDHDHYLKIWALSQPKINADFLLLDEAQDTNPVVEQIFLSQRGHAQLVMVGDSAQAIYDWRGAKDVMTGFDGTQLVLSQSFRFGPHLGPGGQPLAGHRRGTDPPDRHPRRCPPNSGTSPGPTRCCAAPTSAPWPTSWTCWPPDTRWGWPGEGTACALWPWPLATSRRAAAPPTPNCVLFPSWGELQDYAAHDPAGRDLQPLVDLVDTHGTDAILAALAHLAPEQQAEVTVSTAHKAKGREWPCVKIADDFTPPKDTDQHDDTGRPVPGPITTAKHVSPTSPSPAPASASTSAASPGSTSTPAETRRHAESSSATRGGWAAAVTASRKRAGTCRRRSLAPGDAGVLRTAWLMRTGLDAAGGGEAHRTSKAGPPMSLQCSSGIQAARCPQAAPGRLLKL